MMISLMVMGLLAPDDAQAFVYRDVAALDGRPVARMVAVPLAAAPVRPLAHAEGFAPETKFGWLHRLGQGVALAWEPGTRRLMVDADGDATIGPGEVLGLEAGAVSVSVSIRSDSGIVQRVLMFKRQALGGGLNYAVVGHAEGALAFGPTMRRAALVDGDGDGGFATPGPDEVWVDLDGNGKFEPAVERFPLGTVIRTGGHAYTISSDLDGGCVRAFERDGRTGRVRIALGGTGARPASFSANLVSDTGELAVIGQIDAPVEVVTGRYRLAEVRVSVVAADGMTWDYWFRSTGREWPIAVPPAGDVGVSLLEGAQFAIVFPPDTEAVAPGTDLAVTADFRTAGGLYLSDCSARHPGSSDGSSRSASIALRAADGRSLDVADTGFA